MSQDRTHASTVEQDGGIRNEVFVSLRNCDCHLIKDRQTVDYYDLLTKKQQSVLKRYKYAATYIKPLLSSRYYSFPYKLLFGSKSKEEEISTNTCD